VLDMEIAILLFKKPDYVNNFCSVSMLIKKSFVYNNWFSIKTFLMEKFKMRLKRIFIPLNSYMIYLYTSLL
jgi:hypothetical protein